MSNGTSTAAIKLSPSSIDWAKVVLGIAVLGLVYYAYFVQTVEAHQDTKMSCYQWLMAHWSNISNYSHGPLIPLIAIGLVWWKWPDISKTSIEALPGGVALLAVAMMVYYLGVKAVQPRLVVFSFVLVLYGLTLTLGGRQLFGQLFFPITFLLLMIPLNFLDERVGFPLQLLMARSSTVLLHLFGIQARCVGTGIYSDVFTFDVAAPCSGIRSLMALTTVTAAYGYVTQRAQWKRWVLFLSAMPLAVLGNVTRVTSIALVAQEFGQKFAIDMYHEFSGFIVFGVALASMVAIGFLLNFPYRRLFQNWRKPPEKPGPHDDELSLD
jgi:exosortase